jgi:hypothetical protein
MRWKTITAALLVFSMCPAAHSATREELAIKPSGPVMMSPWRLAPEKPASPEWNHYCYSAPVGFYGYGYCGSPYAYGWYGPRYYRSYWITPCP